MSENKPLTKKEITNTAVKMYFELFNKLWLTSFLAVLFSLMLQYILPSGSSTVIGFLVVFLNSFVITFFSGFFFAMMLKIIAFPSGKDSFIKAFDVCSDKIVPLMSALALSSLSVLLGIIVFIIPGIYIALMNFCVIPFVILDDMKVKQAFKSSWALVKGNGWHLFLSYLRALVIPVLIVLVIRLITKFYAPKIISDIIWIALRVAISPYLAILVYVLFYDLKSRKG